MLYPWYAMTKTLLIFLFTTNRIPKRLRTKVYKLDENYLFFRDLYREYADYLYSSAAIMNKKIEFYSSIAYTILKSDQEPI